MAQWWAVRFFRMLTRVLCAQRMSTAEQPKIETIDEDAPPALEDANVRDVRAGVGTC